MLEALVIAGLVAAPLGSAALFLLARHHGRPAGAWAAIWRVILAVAGSAVFAAVAAGVLFLLKATEANLSSADRPWRWPALLGSRSPGTGHRGRICAGRRPPTSSRSTWCTRSSGPSPATSARRARPGRAALVP